MIHYTYESLTLIGRFDTLCENIFLVDTEGYQEDRSLNLQEEAIL
jgi:hypothetical protein